MRFLKYLGCLTVVFLCLTGCGAAKGTPVSTATSPAAETPAQETGTTGVVKKIDTAAQKITFYNVSFNTVEEYQYSGGTEILSQNSVDKSMSQVEPGQVYRYVTGSGSQMLTRMQEASDIQQLQEASVTVDAEKKQITVNGDTTYAYTDNLVVLSDGESIEPLEILDSDQVTFRGVKGLAYSLVVTKGHGYIKPTGYKDFLGGTLTVEGEAIVPVSKEMLLMVPEGQQKMSMVNGDLTGEVEVQVKRGQVTKVDMKKYQSQMPDTARVTFEIQPQGAELYVNGSLTDYSKKVPLKYGNHSIKVVLEGYSDYSGVVTIKDAGPTIRINLAEQEAQVDSSDGSSTDSSVSSDSDSSSSQSEQEKTDTDHKITVSAPAGAAVYINGTYKGVAPCSFTKVIGSVTLTLTKEGCTTKSYSVTITDDAQDVSWSFPDLEAASSQG